MLGSARSAFMVQQGASVTLPAALAAYAFDENTGTTTADSSGNGHTLTLNTATWATGHTGSGLTNTASTAGALADGFTAPTAAISLAGWIRPLDVTAGTDHFAFGFLTNGGGTRAAFFAQRSDFGNPDVLQADILINGSLLALHGPALTVSTWTHVALTYDGTNVVLYQDGAVVDSTTTSGLISSGDAFYVAGANASAPYDTDVVIDDVRVFDVALTQPEVAAAMNTPVS